MKKKLVCRRYHHPILNNHYLTRDVCKQMLDQIRDNPQTFTDWLGHEDGGVKWGEHVRERHPDRILAQAQSYCPGTLIVTTQSDGRLVPTLTTQHTCDCCPAMNDIPSMTTVATESATIVTTSNAMIANPSKAENQTSDISYCNHIRSLVPPTLFHVERLQEYFLSLDETNQWSTESGNCDQSTDTVAVDIFFDHTFLVRSVSLLVQLYPKLTRISMIVRRGESKYTASTAQEDSDDDDNDDMESAMKFCTSSIAALIPVTSVQVFYRKQNSRQILSSILEPWQILILPPLINVIVIPRDASVKHSYIFHLILEEGDTYTGHDFSPQVAKNSRKRRSHDPYLHYEGGDYQVSSAGSSYLCNTWEHPVIINEWVTKSKQEKMVEVMKLDPLAVSKWLTQSKFIIRIEEIRYCSRTTGKFSNKRCPGKLSVTVEDDGTESAEVVIAHKCNTTPNNSQPNHQAPSICISDNVMHIRPMSTFDDATMPEIWVGTIQQSLFCLGGVGNQDHIQSTESVPFDCMDKHSFLSRYYSIATSFYPQYTSGNPKLTTYCEPTLAGSREGSDDGSCDSQETRPEQNMTIITTSPTILLPCQTVKILHRQNEESAYQTALVLANEMLITTPHCTVIVTQVKTNIQRHHNHLICLTLDGNVKSACQHPITVNQFNDSNVESMNGTQRR